MTASLEQPLASASTEGVEALSELFRGRRLVVLAAALIGEAWDLRDSLVYHTPIELAGNLKDVLNTLFWPTVLVLLARGTRVLKRG